MRVVSFESRRADQMRALIAQLGGEPLVAASMREVPLEDQKEAFQFGERLFEGAIDLLILLTGVGTRFLVQALSAKHPKPEIIRALSKITLVARGPKPIAALAEMGLKPTITVPEPNTWRDILHTLDAWGRLNGLRIAVQEYGESNREFLEALKARGAEVIRVPVYRWALPEDLGPLRQAVQAICDGGADVLLFTSANQVEHLFKVAGTMGLEASFLQAAQRCVIASVGPVCTEALVRHHVKVDLEPEHPKMGPLLQQASQKAKAILQRKRGDRL